MIGGAFELGGKLFECLFNLGNRRWGITVERVEDGAELFRVQSVLP